MIRPLSILASLVIHGAIVGVVIGGWVDKSEVEGEVVLDVELGEEKLEEIEFKAQREEALGSKLKVEADGASVLPSISTTPILTVQPKYPRRARKLGIEGITQVRVLIGNDGLVKEALLENSSGFKDLDKAALDAAKGSRFNEEHQIEYRDAILTFEFTLDGKR